MPDDSGSDVVRVSLGVKHRLICTHSDTEVEEESLLD